MSDRCNDDIIIDTFPNDGDKHLNLINASYAWKKTKGGNTKVLIIDSGVDVNHEDIAPSFVSGVNFVDMNKDLSDKYGHGTHVAGLIVGRKTGVAPESKLYVAKSLSDEGVGDARSIVEGINYGINLKVDIIVMSLGHIGDMPKTISQAIVNAQSKGIIIVSAVGNDGIHKINAPARDVIGVGGVDDNLEYAKFSNRGEELDMTAPSTNILSTYMDNKYAYMTGTSMATGIVAGALALIISNARNNGISLTVNEVYNIIKGNNNNSHSHFYGYGVLDMKNFM